MVGSIPRRWGRTKLFQGRPPCSHVSLAVMPNKGHYSALKKSGQGGDMEHEHDEIESLPAVVEREPGTPALIGQEDLERLRREITAPAIVQEAGPNAEYAYADFFKAKISNP